MNAFIHILLNHVSYIFVKWSVHHFVVQFGALVGGYVAGFVHALTNSLMIFCFFINMGYAKLYLKVKQLESINSLLNLIHFNQK